MDQSFVDALNELMAGSGISNNELARRIDVDPAQIGRWRKGRGRPRPENLVRAAAVFGVDHRWLWALAYPEGMPVSGGPIDPQWSGLAAELEAGWRAMDASTRALAERTARVLFSVPPTGATEHRSRRANAGQRLRKTTSSDAGSGPDSTSLLWWTPAQRSIAFAGAPA